MYQVLLTITTAKYCTWLFSSVVTRVSRVVSRPALAASLSWADTVGWKLWSTNTASTEEKACTLSEVLHRGRGEGGVRTG